MSIQGRKYTYHIDGNTVREVPAAPKKKSVRHLINWDKARQMDFKYVTFLACLLLISGLILSNYVGLQADITTSVKRIARLERDLNNLRLENEENYSRITNNVDLDFIRRVAIQELGMIYAKEGQIIDFIGNNGDYVRQLNPLP